MFTHFRCKNMPPTNQEDLQSDKCEECDKIVIQEERWNSEDIEYYFIVLF